MSLQEVGVNVLSEMIGKTFASVNTAHDTIIFAFDDKCFILGHEQDCCETVEITDICGDLRDLAGSPMLIAEETGGIIEQKDDAPIDWTFYRFATARGTVTVRFEGASEFYSTYVSLRLVNL